jgi:hypothetical protein
VFRETQMMYMTYNHNIISHQKDLSLNSTNIRNRTITELTSKEIIKIKIQCY